MTALVHSLVDEYAPLFENRRLTATSRTACASAGTKPCCAARSAACSRTRPSIRPKAGASRSRCGSGRPLLTVENDCDPIPEDELPRLFEMFYRGDKARNRAGGHGLGLAITQKILALHGLTCRAENTKSGVRFYVTSR